MRPSSIISLIICCVVAVAAFAVGICFDFHILNKDFWLVAVKNGGPLGALVFAVIYYFSSRPKIIDIPDTAWTTTSTNPDWNELTVTIPKSKHGRGKFPTVTFLTRGQFASCDTRYTYKTETNGDIVICHCHNRFMPPFVGFTVKITK